MIFESWVKYTKMPIFLGQFKLDQKTNIQHVRHFFQTLYKYKHQRGQCSITPFFIVCNIIRKTITRLNVSSRAENVQCQEFHPYNFYHEH